MGVCLSICVTCKSAACGAEPAAGARLADLVEREANSRRAAPRILRRECLWACSQSCAIVIEEAGKVSYIAGRFAATEEAARAIVDWAEAYGQSPSGEVRYRQWPDGMKGHFIARIPVD